jgi:hypothetical protein
MPEIIAMGHVVGSWARQQGAREVRVNGRKGWARALRGLGFQPDGKDLRKAL